MSNFFREKSGPGIGALAMGREEIRIGGTTVTVKERLAEGGFGFVDLVTDASNRDFVVEYIIIRLFFREINYCVMRVYS